MGENVTLALLFTILTPICSIFLIMLLRIDDKTQKLYDHIINNKLITDQRKITRA